MTNFPVDMKLVDRMLAASPSWDELDKVFRPAQTPDAFEPKDRVKEFFAAAWRTQDGRAALSWLLEITTFAPYPPIGSSLEAAALAAKAHEARAAVGRVVMAAITEGTAILDKPKEPRT